MNTQLITRIEQFLYYEAQLLDSLQFEAWASLFTQDGVYQVPPTNLPHADSATSLYLVNDDRHRITERAKRLTKKTAHAEYPASRTCRVVSNVTGKLNDGGNVEAACNFVVYRSRSGRLDVFPGRSEYLLEQRDALLITDQRAALEQQALWIKRKRATLSLETLRPQGKVSLIL